MIWVMDCREFTKKLSELGSDGKRFFQSIEKRDFVYAKGIQAQIEKMFCEAFFEISEQIELRRYLAKKNKFSSIGAFYDDRALARDIRGLSFFVDKYGNAKSDTFFKANEFKEGMALVKNTGHYYFIDKDGNKIGGDYDGAKDFNEEYATVCFEQIVDDVIRGEKSTIRRTIFIDKAGENTFGKEFRDAYSFSEGLAAVQDSDTTEWYFIDQTGKRVLPASDDQTFHEANSFSEGLARVQTNEWIFIDKNGKEIAGFFSQARNFHEGRAQVYDGKKWFFIDTTGKPIIKSNLFNKFEITTDFHEGFASVSRTKTVNLKNFEPYREMSFHYFIDRNGKRLNNKEYFRVGSFKNGFAAISPSYKKGQFNWSFIDKSGNEITSEYFDEVSDFTSNGLVRVKKDEKWFYINNSGHRAFPEEFDMANDFQGGVACVRRGSNIFYIDKQGRFVFGDGHDR